MEKEDCELEIEIVDGDLWVNLNGRHRIAIWGIKEIKRVSRLKVRSLIRRNKQVGVFFEGDREK